MRILVTGGCGFIGANLTRYLINETAHHVINLDKLTYAGNPHSLSDIAGSDRYEFVKADIADPAQIRRVFESVDPDAVAHLAAESHVDRSIDGPSEFIQTNVVGTFNLLDSALAHKHADLITYVTDRPGHDFRYAIDSSKIQSELNWTPKHSLEVGLRQTAQWYVQNQDWWQNILDGNYKLERLGR